MSTGAYFADTGSFFGHSRHTGEPGPGTGSTLEQPKNPAVLDLPSLRLCNENYKFYFVFGQFPAELGPETRSNGSGSKNGAERTQN